MILLLARDLNLFKKKTRFSFFDKFRLIFNILSKKKKKKKNIHRISNMLFGRWTDWISARKDSKIVVFWWYSKTLGEQENKAPNLQSEHKPKGARIKIQDTWLDINSNTSLKSFDKLVVAMYKSNLFARDKQERTSKMLKTSVLVKKHFNVISRGFRLFPQNKFITLERVYSCNPFWPIEFLYAVSRKRVVVH